MTDAVACTGLIKRAGKRTVIEGVDFGMPSGQMWSVIGARGAGRSTLVRLIAGLTRPDAGAVHVFGLDTVREAKAVQAIIGYVPQGVGSYDTLTVGENLELHADLRGVAANAWPARSREILALTGLGNQTGERAAALSPAARRRLALACALAAMPRLLLLDEFTAGLDPSSRGEMLEVLRRLGTEEDISIFMSTTYADEAERCDGVVFLNDGRLVACGSPSDLMSRTAARMRTVAVAADDRHAAAARMRVQEGVIDVEVYRTRLTVIADHANSVAASSDTVAPRLDDAFVCLLHDRGVAMLAPLALRPWAGGRLRSGLPALEVSGLTARQNGRPLVRDFELAVAHGEIVGLIGPNGPRKDLVLHLLCGLEQPAEGVIKIGGTDLASDPRHALARLAHIDSAASPYPDLTPVHILQFFASACGLARARSRDRISYLLAELGLEQAATVQSGDLSTALQWRVALAAALVHEPELVLLGAPRSHLDPLTRRLVWSDISAVAAAGVGVLVASQVADDAERCDRAQFFEREAAVEAASDAAARTPSGPVALAALSALFARAHQRRSAE